MDDNYRGTKELIFRMHLIAMVKARESAGESRASAVKEVAAILHHDLESGKARRVASRTLYRWLAGFDRGGREALLPKAANPSKRGALEPGFLDFLRREKELDPACSTPELIQRAGESGLIGPGRKLSRITVWRRIRDLGLPVERLASREHNSRRFSFLFRNQMVLCDGKHFRAGASRSKRVVLIFLDDATRFALKAVVGESESCHLFLRGLYGVVQKHGLMQCLYLDNGSGFTADDSSLVAQALGIHMIHSTAGYPQGRGKIERFNRTLQNACLRSFPGNPAIEGDCAALERRINHWLDTVYNHRIHESLDGQSPFGVFMSAKQPAPRFPPAREWEEAFVIRHRRRVSRDNIVSFRSLAFEMPSGYARQWVHIRHRVLEDSIHFIHEGREIRLTELQPAMNARGGRGGNRGKAEESPVTSLPPRTHADMVYEKQHAPMVDKNGGYAPKPKTGKDKPSSGGGRP